MKNRFKDFAIKLIVVIITLAVLSGGVKYFMKKIEFSNHNIYTDGARNAEDHIKIINELMKNRDHLAVSEYAKRNEIRFDYGSEQYDYMEVFSAANTFENIYERLLELRLNDKRDELPSYMIDSLNGDIKSLYRLTDESKLDAYKGNSHIYTYMKTLREDTSLFLKTYLKLSDEQIAMIGVESENKIAVMIEEAYKNEWSK